MRCLSTDTPYLRCLSSSRHIIAARYFRHDATPFDVRFHCLTLAFLHCIFADIHVFHYIFHDTSFRRFYADIITLIFSLIFFSFRFRHLRCRYYY